MCEFIPLNKYKSLKEKNHIVQAIPCGSLLQFGALQMWGTKSIMLSQHWMVSQSLQYRMEKIYIDRLLFSWMPKL